MNTLKFLVFITLAVVISASALNSSTLLRSEENKYQIGNTVPDLKFKKTSDGQMVFLSDFKNTKGFVLILLADDHCPYSAAYKDRILALNNKYRTLGYPVIAIHSNIPNSYDALDYKKIKLEHFDKDATLPYLLDENQVLYQKYGATKAPQVFILQKKESKFVFSYTGAIDNNYKDASSVTEKYVEQALRSLIKGYEIQVPITKSIGCSLLE